MMLATVYAAMTECVSGNRRCVFSLIRQPRHGILAVELRVCIAYIGARYEGIHATVTPSDQREIRDRGLGRSFMISLAILPRVTRVILSAGAIGSAHGGPQAQCSSVTRATIVGRARTLFDRAQIRRWLGKVGTATSDHYARNRRRRFMGESARPDETRCRGVATCSPRGRKRIRWRDQAGYALHARKRRQSRTTSRYGAMTCAPSRTSWHAWGSALWDAWRRMLWSPFKRFCGCYTPC
jgi:hypothetical protein